jgi:hypothetical protein
MVPGEKEFHADTSWRRGIAGGRSKLSDPWDNQCWDLACAGVASDHRRNAGEVGEASSWRRRKTMMTYLGRWEGIPKILEEVHDAEREIGDGMNLVKVEEGLK